MPPSGERSPDLRIQRDSTYDSLEEIVEAAQNVAADVFADEERRYCFVLALSEAVANAIEHGNASDPAKQLTVELFVEKDRVEATVTDEGAGFDPEGVTDPLEASNLTRTHGRGLHIIKEMADSVDYEAEGRRVRMSFSRTT